MAGTSHDPSLTKADQAEQDFPYELRSVTEAEFDEFWRSVARGFGGDAHEANRDTFRSMLSLDRTVACFDPSEANFAEQIDAGAIVGTLGDSKIGLTVPGGSVIPMAGTTVVTVRSTHRRRGILRAMIHRHLEMAAARGEPIAGLWASESAIYGRFGFGLATELHQVSLDARNTSVTAPPPSLPGQAVTVSMVPADQVLDVIVPHWADCGADRAGWIDIDESRWNALIADHEHRRQGASALRYAVARRGGQVIGSAVWRQRESWERDIPNGKVEVEWVTTTSHDAHRALWHHLTHIDLYPNVSWSNAPIDDVLALEVTNQRHVCRVVGDALYLRVLNLPACLHSRTYEADGSVVLNVGDDLGYCCGRWALDVINGQATVKRLDTHPDDADPTKEVRLDARHLGSLYLGSDIANRLAAAGHISGTPAAVRTLIRIMGTTSQPYCPADF